LKLTKHCFISFPAATLFSHLNFDKVPFSLVLRNIGGIFFWTENPNLKKEIEWMKFQDKKELQISFKNLTYEEIEYTFYEIGFFDLDSSLILIRGTSLHKNNTDKLRKYFLPKFEVLPKIKVLISLKNCLSKIKTFGKNVGHWQSSCFSVSPWKGKEI